MRNRPSTSLRFLFWLALPAFLVGPSTAQVTSQRLGAEHFQQVDAGQHWRVLQTSVRKNAAGELVPSEPNHFVVFPAFAIDDIEDKGILPALEAQEIREDLAAEGLDYRAVYDLHIVHIEAAIDAHQPADKRSPSHPASPQPSIFDLFGWASPKTYHQQFEWNEQGDYEIIDIDQGLFTGNVTASLPIHANIDVTVIYQVKWRLVPYKVRLIEARANGSVDIQGSIVATAGLEYTHSWNWKKRLATIHLGDFVIWLGVIPVYLEFTLPIDIGIDTQVKVGGQASLQANFGGTGTFDVVCDASNCEGDTEFTDSFHISDPTYEFTLDAHGKIWARAGLDLAIYDDDLALISVGATGFAQAHLFGYLGNQCGDADGDGEPDTIEDLLVDADVGYSIDAGLSGHLLPNREWNLLGGVRHLAFWDIWEDSEGYNLIEPIVSGPMEFDAGEWVTYEFRTRECYPYAEDITYRWTGPVEGSGTMPPQSGLLTSSGRPAAGEHRLEVFAQDAHGRDFGRIGQKSIRAVDPFPDAVPLTNHLPISNLPGSLPGEALFVIDLPEGSSDLRFQLSGGTGNADLYVRQDARPTLTAYLCRSTGSGNSELCAVPTPTAGRYYVQLFGVFSGATLVASYDGPTAAPLSHGVPQTGLHGSLGSREYFTIDVPPGSADLQFTLSPGSGDADLYVRYSTWPGTSANTYTCRSVESDSADVCRFASPLPGTYYAMVHAYSNFADAQLLATYVETNNVGGALENGIAKTDLFGAAGGEILYSIKVPAGATDLRISTTGGTGDADFFVRHGAIPTIFDYDCPARAPGNDESCTFEDPKPGMYYILVRAFSTYSGVQLLAQYTEATALTKGVPVTLTGGKDDEQYFLFEVPENAKNLNIRLAGGTGDGDLYVRYGAQPTFLLKDCQSRNLDNNEACVFESPQAGRYHVLVHGYESFADTELVADYLPPPAGGKLVNGVRVADLVGSAQDAIHYHLEVPAEATHLEIQLLGGTGDADLYVRYGLQASTSEYDCRSWNDGTDEHCVFDPSQTGTYHLLVYGYDDFSGASLTATYRQPKPQGGELINGIPKEDLAADDESEIFYTLDVPGDARDLTFTLSGGAGDADLYIRHGERPTVEVYECGPQTIGNAEECQIPNPQPGTYHVMVHGYGAYTGLDLVGRFTPVNTIFQDDFESGGLTSWAEPPP